jgi:hypothetical protein
MSAKTPERIVAAAISYADKGDGWTVYFEVQAPARHGDVMAAARKHGLGVELEREQGFSTSRGRFVDREEAWRIAEAAGQLLPRAPTDYLGGTLYSEDVW